MPTQDESLALFFECSTWLAGCSFKATTNYLRGRETQAGEPKDNLPTRVRFQSAKKVNVTTRKLSPVAPSSSGKLSLFSNSESSAIIEQTLHAIGRVLNRLLSLSLFLFIAKIFLVVLDRLVPAHAAIGIPYRIVF